MATIWFIIAVIFFALWISRKPKNSDDSQTYRQGYWDGYRAFGDQVKEKMDKGEVKSRDLKKFIADGYPSDWDINSQIEDAELGRDDALDDQPISEHYETIRAMQVESVSQTPIKSLPVSPEVRKSRNLNTMLYVASFLLVAAAAAFVATNMDSSVKLVGVWLVTVLFYTTGLLLFNKIQRLRPAAIAFIGTGLAILPFSGYALYELGGYSGSTAWLVTSLVGLIAYFIAALVTKSQLVSYLTMAFVLSLTLSSVSVVSGPIVSYFISIIAISLFANIISFLRPTWLPDLFKRPLESTGQIVTPVALVASLVLIDRISLFSYELVFAVATAHYLVVWLQMRTVLYETVIRILAHGTFLLIGWDIVGQEVRPFAIVWLLLATIQALYSLVRLRSKHHEIQNFESIWLACTQVLILFGSMLWTKSEYAAEGILASFGTIGVISVCASLRLKRASWLIPTLFVSLLMPFILGRWAVEPAWEWSVLSWIFIFMAVSVLVTYRKVYVRSSLNIDHLLQVSFWLYLVFALMTAMAHGEAIIFSVIGLVVAMLAVLFSFIARQIWAEIAAAVLFVIVVTVFVSDVSTNYTWNVTIAILSSIVVLYGAAFAHHRSNQSERRDLVILVAQLVLAGFVFTAGAIEKEVVTTSFLIMLGALTASLFFRVTIDADSKSLRQIFQISYPLYAVVLMILSFNLGLGWTVIATFTGTIVAWIASHVERSPALAAIGNALLVWTMSSIWLFMEFEMSWATIGVAWLSALIIYGTYWLSTASQDIARQQIHLISVWILLAGAALLNFGAPEDGLKIASALSTIALGGTLAIHAYNKRNKDQFELSVYIAAFGLQRVIGILIPDLTIVFYAHITAAVVVGMAWWRRGVDYRTRVMSAIGLITLATGIKALEEGGGYQLLFLVEHIGLLVYGALSQKMWAVWWGVAASVLAVLYFLKDYPYIALAFLGLVLIAIVIWRLILPGKDHTHN